MTAVAAPAPAGARHPVPWTRLAWVTWRQHRVALVGVAVLLGGLGRYLLIMGLAQTMTGFLQVVPVLVGVFVGGPVLARELETGTFRFAWTQGCGRLRRAVTKLVLLALTVTLAAEAFSLLFSWYFQPWFAEGLDGALAPQLFDLRGIDFAAWTLLAFALGVAGGVPRLRQRLVVGTVLHRPERQAGEPGHGQQRAPARTGLRADLG